MPFKRAGEVELVGDFYIGNGRAAAVSFANVTDSRGEYPRRRLVQFRLDRVDEDLIILTVLISGHEGVQAVLHVVFKEVPRIGLLEARHGKDVLRLLSVYEELERK